MTGKLTILYFRNITEPCFNVAYWPFHDGTILIKWHSDQYVIKLPFHLYISQLIMHVTRYLSVFTSQIIIYSITVQRATYQPLSHYLKLSSLASYSAFHPWDHNLLYIASHFSTRTPCLPFHISLYNLSFNTLHPTAQSTLYQLSFNHIN